MSPKSLQVSKDFYLVSLWWTYILTEVWIIFKRDFKFYVASPTPPHYFIYLFIGHATRLTGF